MNCFSRLCHTWNGRIRPIPTIMLKNRRVRHIIVNLQNAHSQFTGDAVAQTGINHELENMVSLDLGFVARALICSLCSTRGEPLKKRSK